MWVEGALETQEERVRRGREVGAVKNAELHDSFNSESTKCPSWVDVTMGEGDCWRSERSVGTVVVGVLTSGFDNLLSREFVRRSCLNLIRLFSRGVSSPRLDSQGLLTFAVAFLGVLLVIIMACPFANTCSIEGIGARARIMLIPQGGRVPGVVVGRSQFSLVRGLQI